MFYSVKRSRAGGLIRSRTVDLPAGSLDGVAEVTDQKSHFILHRKVYSRRNGSKENHW